MASESLSIGQVSVRSGLSPDTLRYYEAMELLPPITRDGSGWRRYPASILGSLEIIQLMRRAGFSIQEIKAVMLSKAEHPEPQARVLHAQRELKLLQERVHEQQRTLEQAEALLSSWLAELEAFLRSAPSQEDV